MARIIAMNNNEYNRTATKQFLVTAGIVSTSIITLATLTYFGFQNLIHKINSQSNPTQPDNLLFIPGNDVLNTPTTPTSAVGVQNVDCIEFYGKELLQNHNKITITINGRTMTIEPNTPIELCGIPVTPTP